tara:strand:- start:1109 stop:3094 length:1986 start_codon:yes stop_codon:yes gene_type:complete
MTVTLTALQKQRRDTASNWNSNNTVLLAGEWGIESDTKKFKIGDGTTAWQSLDYVPIPDANRLLTGNLTVGGDFTVNGTTTTVNTTNLDVEDKNITLGKVSTPSDTTADGGGITLKGATDKTFNWVDSTDSWTSSEHITANGQKEMRYADADSSNYVGFKAPATVSSNVVWTLPNQDAAVNGYVLASDGSGNLSWVDAGSSSNPTISGDITLQNDGLIRGFSTLQATYTGSTKVLTVTVASKTANHRYNGTGSSNGYKINGYEAPFITLTAGRTYRFDQSDSSNANHPLRFYLEADKTTAYTTGVTTNGTAGQSGAYTQIVVSDTTPLILHYQCSAHAYMGNAVSTNSNVVNYNDLLNKPTIPTNNNQLTNGAGFIDGSALNASNLSSGTIPDARFPATLPAANASNLTNLDASDLASGTIPDARFPNVLPAISGANLTNLPQSGSGTADLLDIASSSATGGGSASFNGVAYRFKLVTKGTSNAVTPANAEILRVSINGVMQQPNDGTGQGDMTDGYVVNGTDIIFDSPPATGSTYFIINMGAAVAIGNSTTSTLADESSDTTCFPVFATGATGDLALKTGTNLTFNASNGQLTATSYAGDGSNLTGVSSQVADGCITENSLTISNNYTMTTNKSGISAGDIIIASGVTVTIPSGSRYVIV